MSFGVSTDYFGLADTDWELQSSDKTGEASSAQCEDAFGDIVAQEEYEETETVSVTYKLKSNGTAGVVSLPTNFKGGYVGPEVGGENYVITGGSLDTSNSERPILTVTGEQVHGADDGFETYDWASEIGSIPARKLAHPIGFELGANTALNSSSANFSCDVTRVLDADGDIAVLDVSKGRIEVSGELVSCTSVGSATAASGWALASANDASENNTDYGGSTVNVYKNLIRDSESA